MPGAERGSYPAGIRICIVHPDEIVNGCDVVHVDSVTHAQEHHDWCKEEHEVEQKHVTDGPAAVLKTFPEVILTREAPT